MEILRVVQQLICIDDDIKFPCSFMGESMDPDATLVFAYYKEGASNPTFLYPAYALKEEKC